MGRSEQILLFTALFFFLLLALDHVKESAHVLMPIGHVFQQNCYKK